MLRVLLLLLICFLILRRINAADSTPATPNTSCTDELVTFSSCLPFVAVFPNNMTDSPSPKCCDVVSAAFLDGSAVCFCYLKIRPGILGFPVNSTKLSTMISVCPLKDQQNRSLDSLCSGPKDLPPLESISDPFNSRPSPPSPPSSSPSPPGPSRPSSPDIDVKSPPMASNGSTGGTSSSNPTNEVSPPHSPKSAATEVMFKISLCVISFLVYVYSAM